MIKYVALERFADLQDDKRIYDVGEIYPRVGLNVSEDRLVALSTSQNGANRPLIKKVSIEEAKVVKSDAQDVTEANVEKVKEEEIKVEKVDRNPSGRKPKTEIKETPKPSNRKAIKKNAN